jgi:hypothetical protein
MKHITANGLIVFLTLLLITLLMIYKSYFAFIDMRYLVYGYDAPRTMSYAQTIYQRNILSTDIPPRYGLVTYAGLWGKLLNVPPSQLFVIPFWTINALTVFLIFFVAKSLHKSNVYALLAAAVFVAFAIPNHVTDANFYAFLIAPLRFVFLVRWIKQKELISWWGMSYLLISIAGQLTYPIFHIIINTVMIVTLLIYTTGIYPRFNLKIATIFGFNTLTRLAAFILTAYKTEAFNTPADVLNRIYVFWYAPFSIKAGAMLIIALSLIEIIAILWLLIQPKHSFNFSLSRLYHTKLKPLIPYAVTAVFTAFIGTLVMAFRQPAKFEQSLYLYAMAIVWPLVISHPRRYLRHRTTKIMFIVLSILLFGLLLPLPPALHAIQNNRFFQLTEVFLALFIARLIVKAPLSISVLLVALILAAYPYTVSKTKELFFVHGDLSMAETLDAFYADQAETNKTLFYASYAYKPVLLPNERFQSQTYISTSIPWKNQWFMSQCRANDGVDCYELYREAITEHQAKYLIIEQLPQDDDPNIPLLKSLGTVIADSGVTIVKL